MALQQHDANAQLKMAAQKAYESVYKAYGQMVSEQSTCVAQEMSYCVEWTKNDLPLENEEGTAAYYKLNAMRNPLLMSAMPQGIMPPVASSDGKAVMAPKENVLVFSDSYGFCQGILKHAPKNRLGRTQVVTKAPGAFKQKDVEKLLGDGWDLIIFGCGIDTPRSNSAEDVHKYQADVMRLYLWILLEILKKGVDKAASRLACITCDTFAEEREIHEECGIGMIACAGLFGFTNSARIEMEMPIQFIDTEWALTDDRLPWLSSEVFRSQSFGQASVRLLNSGRYVLRQQRTKPYETLRKGEEFPLPFEGVIAITGGNGALGLVMGGWLMTRCEQQLAKTGQPFTGLVIKFLSRSMKISDMNMPAWKDIQQRAEALGITAEQGKCDAGSEVAVHEFIAENSPDLVGIIHSAGVLHDGMLMNMTWEKFEAAFEGKSRAAVFIHQALQQNPNPNLRFYWMFSSTAVYGNMGQTNYSCANSFMDSLARHRRALGLPGMVVQWGAWGEVGMASTLDDASKRRMAQSPVPAFSNKEGLAGLESGLRSRLPYFTVCKYTPDQLFKITGFTNQVHHQYFRNFMRGVTPTPPPPMEDPDVYDSIAYTFDSLSSQRSPGLVYDAYVAPFVDEDDDW